MLFTVEKNAFIQLHLQPYIIRILYNKVYIDKVNKGNRIHLTIKKFEKE